MNNEELKITIFTDGSSRGNPGPGGWGAVVVTNGIKTEVAELGGGEKHTTNNRMELTAAVEAISHVSKMLASRSESKSESKNLSLLINTDSSYVINGITKWIAGWKKNNWKTKAKQDVLNKDLWMKLDSCVADHHVQWRYVGGHIGILGNERCDHIATAFADGRTVKLYRGKLSNYDLLNILDVSHDEGALIQKKSSSSRSNAKAYSYISMVGGIIETHRTWAECEKRVKGVKGARYKKSFSRENEEEVIGEFEAF